MLSWEYFHKAFPITKIKAVQVDSFFYLKEGHSSINQQPAPAEICPTPTEDPFADNKCYNAPVMLKFDLY